MTVLKSALGIYDNPNGIYKGLLSFSLIFFIVFLIVTFLGRTRYVFIETLSYGKIKLFDNNPNQVELSKFLQKFNWRIKNYLKKKYTDFDKDISKEIQLQNIFWLEKNEIITKEEYEDLKNKLLNHDTSVIKGFS